MRRLSARGILAPLVATILLAPAPSYADTDDGPPRGDRFEAARERAQRRGRPSASRRLARLATDTSLTSEEAMRETRSALLDLAGLTSVSDQLEEEDDVWIEHVPVGDLDGDGGGDLLEYEYRYLPSGEQIKITAIRGASGQIIWSLDGSNFEIAIPAGNLDGQAGVDLFVMTIQNDPDADPVYETENFNYRAIRGTDASTIWTRSIRNDWTFIPGPLSVIQIEKDYTVPQTVVGDLNADGASELLIGRFNIERVTVGPATHWSSTVTFEALSGRTGAAAFTMTEEIASEETELWGEAFGELSGDGRADIGVFRTTDGASSGNLTAYSGASATALWTSTYQAPTDNVYLILELAQIDDDGRNDLLLTMEGFDGGDFFTELAVYSGKTGATLWTHRFEPGFPYFEPTADANGDGWGDILLEGWGDDDETGQGNHYIRLLSGKTKQPIWSRVNEVSNDQPFEFWSLVGDATGDGVPDLIVERYAVGKCYEEDGEVWCDHIPTGDRVLRSGANTAARWSRPIQPVGYSYFYGVADVNGDGAGELIDMIDVEIGEEEWETRYVLVSGRTGQNLWGSWLDPNAYIWWVETADLRGAPGSDLLEWRDTTLVGRAGTGAALWSRPLPPMGGFGA